MRALAIYRRHFAALVLTCALALVPANLLMAGAVVFGLGAMNAVGVTDAKTTHSQQIQNKQRDLQEKPPPSPEDRDVRLKQLGREAFEGNTVFDADQVKAMLPMIYAVLISVALLVIGLSLAHAALTPLVLDLAEGAPTGPARAWAAVALRLRALFVTALLGAPLVALGMVLCFVPGVVVAVGFGFAVPVAMAEGRAGRAALERSWALARRHWVPLLGQWAVIALFTAIASGVATLLPAGPWRALAAALVRVVLYPLPLAALVLLYADVRRREGEAVRV